MATGLRPSSSSASKTTIWASPRAPPAPSASAKVFIAPNPSLLPCPHCPASRANDQAVAASGRTISALAGAYSLVAVPSRTRPTMPW